MLDLDGTDALLLVGDSERSADMLYATGFSAPDPFVFLQTDRAKYLLIGDLELDRARDQARVDEVLSLSRYDRLAADRLDEAADEERLGVRPSQHTPCRCGARSTLGASRARSRGRA